MHELIYFKVLYLIAGLFIIGVTTFGVLYTKIINKKINVNFLNFFKGIKNV